MEGLVLLVTVRLVEEPGHHVADSHLDSWSWSRILEKLGILRQMFHDDNLVLCEASRNPDTLSGSMTVWMELLPLELEEVAEDNVLYMWWLSRELSLMAPIHFAPRQGDLELDLVCNTPDLW